MRAAAAEAAESSLDPARLHAVLIKKASGDRAAHHRVLSLYPASSSVRLLLRHLPSPDPRLLDRRPLLPLPLPLPAVLRLPPPPPHPPQLPSSPPLRWRRLRRSQIPLRLPLPPPRTPTPLPRPQARHRPPPLLRLRPRLPLRQIPPPLPRAQGVRRYSPPGPRLLRRRHRRPRAEQPPRPALALFASMRARGVRSTMYAVSAALRAAADLAALDLSRCAHAHALVVGLDADLFVATALLDAYGKAGLVADARRVLDALLGAANLVTWNAMLAAHAQQGTWTPPSACSAKCANATSRQTI
uniref:Pentatricopeptide repeat-containing protein n=1 Tax=Ananas comosus var. bracteatus TaxID=296719 RepID=A0A6V7PZF8_ANACO|nr:unnamed protein product [Ananas comosus var. bracteatus]